MAVKSASLENREREMNLSDRDEKPKKDSAAAELAALRARISSVRLSPPADTYAHTPGPRLSFCSACFRRGVLAALDALGEG